MRRPPRGVRRSVGDRQARVGPLSHEMLPIRSAEAVCVTEGNTLQCQCSSKIDPPCSSNSDPPVPVFLPGRPVFRFEVLWRASDVGRVGSGRRSPRDQELNAPRIRSTSTSLQSGTSHRARASTGPRPPKAVATAGAKERRRQRAGVRRYARSACSGGFDGCIGRLARVSALRCAPLLRSS